MPEAYATNTTPTDMAAWLRTRKSMVVTTHSKPDGDALGSTLAMTRTLIRVGIPAEAWFIGPFPQWTDAVAGATPTRKLSHDNLQLPSTSPDGVLICDTGAWTQLEGLKAWLQQGGRREAAAIIDHHLHGQADVASRRIITTVAASATHAAAPVIDALLNLKPTDPLPRDIADALYLGLATDTGWFRFSNTTPETLRFAARLLDSGVNHPALYEQTEQQQKHTRPVLLGKALTSLTMHHANRLGVMLIRDADLRAAGAVGEDTGGFAEPVLAVAGVQVVATLTEMPPQPDGRPLVKVSLRSKPGPSAVDVAALANTLGGGGHARAAGVKLYMPAESAVQTIINACKF